MTERARDPNERGPGQAEEDEGPPRAESAPAEAHLTRREVEAYLATRAGAARVEQMAARYPGLAYVLALLAGEDESD
jgi:hypothetical protein